MTRRGRIITELHRRLRAAFPKAVLSVAAAVEIRPTAGQVVVVLMPGEEAGWSPEQYESDQFRDWSIGMQIARARTADEAKDPLAAWVSLEALAEDCRAAVRGTDPTLGGLLSADIDLADIEPSEQPVGGVAIGLDIVWSLRYALVP